ncbi:ribosomal protein S18-alanine N-acetyltransferase [Pseudaeromonas sharmana]|uniref:[Ribosomal protein bS18]-alanine N-acetyltransferase n=1 Tax=Pseudaeromonas sharmana TaxID=328412 RepID=A0ABV8CMF0_9GAMM
MVPECRPLCPDQLSLMLPIEQAAHIAPWSANLLAQSFGERYLTVGIWQGEQLLGFYIADWLLDESTLHNICVAPGVRRLGYGARLLEDYLHRSAARGCACWWLEVRRSNAAAIALYQRYGYQIAGCRKAYYRHEDGVEDALVMQRQSEALA